MHELFAQIGDHPSINDEFHCDVEKNISIGDQFLANYNVTILDRMPVTIGDCVMLASNVVITTTGHPLDAEKRREHIGIAKPVTIGNNVVVAAGAVVNKDIPDNSLAGGVPAKIIRKLSC